MRGDGIPDVMPVCGRGGLIRCSETLARLGRRQYGFAADREATVFIVKPSLVSEHAVMPVRGAVDALAQLRGLGAVATLDRFPGLGHGIDRRVVDAILRRLDDAAPASI